MAAASTGASVSTDGADWGSASLEATGFTLGARGAFASSSFLRARASLSWMLWNSVSVFMMLLVMPWNQGTFK